MVLSNPQALMLALLVVPVVALYLWRVRPRPVRVATGFLWEQAAPKHGVRALWRPWRPLFSLCLGVALLGLMVLAAADPHVPAPRTLLLVVDASASMGATDVAPSRFAEAKRLGGQAIAGLRYGDRMAILSAAETVQVHCGLTDAKESLEAALDTMPVAGGRARVVEAVALARRMTGGAPNGRVLVLSDGGFDGAAEMAAADDVDLVLVGGGGDNVAMSRLEARRTPSEPRRCQVLAQVSSYSDQSVQGRVELLLDDKPLESVAVELAPRGRWQHVFEMTTEHAGSLVARWTRDDDLIEDNRATASFAARPTRRVTLVSEGCPPLQRAFEAIPLVELHMVESPPATTARDHDVTVFDGRVPGTLPAGPVLVVGPTGPCDLWQLGDAVEEPEIARQRSGSPILASVDLTGTWLGSARRLELTASAERIAWPLAWTSDGIAVAYAIERPSGRVLVCLGDLPTGDLAQQTAFPTLMSNALDWLVAPAGRREASATITPASESDLRTPTIEAALADVPPAEANRPPPWMLLAAGAVLLLLVEWALFQRRWVC